MNLSRDNGCDKGLSLEFVVYSHTNTLPIRDDVTEDLSSEFSRVIVFVTSKVRSYLFQGTLC